MSPHSVVLTQAQRKVVADLLPKLSDRMKLDEKNCPPEDDSGILSYAEFLEAIVDPKHEQHDDFAEWADKFNAEEIARVTRRGLTDWRQDR